MIDYLIGDPLHFVMERKMMLGLKQRAEHFAAGPDPGALAPDGPSGSAGSRK